MAISRILVADDEESIRWVLSKALKKQGYTVDLAEDGSQAKQLADKRRYDLAILDIKMPGFSGLELLTTFRAQHPQTLVIIMTAEATMEHAVTAMKNGAYDYLTKPFDLTELDAIILKATNAAAVTEQMDQLKGELQDHYKFGRTIIGNSQPMQDVYKTLGRVAGSDVTVLITGESGTGKELIVDALHQRGVRKEKPLVKVNCSTLSENLLETELFGHVKGAFTGSIKDNPGRFELAQGGTIFLDEIGDISLRLQVKLLRVLQEKIIERVGDATPIAVDVRVVAATHQDLAAKIRSGEFREDLFYRLKVVNIALPPLRERRTDIPLLVEHFIELFNTRFCRQVRGVSAAVERFFLSYHWPGNIRELEHVIEHAFILCQQDQLELEHLPPDLPLTSVVKPVQLQADPAAAIGAALSQAGGNKAKAARLLGMSRRTIYRKIKEFNIPVD